MTTAKSAPEKFSEISPETHRGFLLNKRVRNQPMLHAMELGGYVFAHLSNGRQGMLEQVDKLLEEMAEYAKSTSPENLLEETCDVLDAIAQTEKEIGKAEEIFVMPFLDVAEITERLLHIKEGLTQPSCSEASSRIYFQKLLGHIRRCIVRESMFLDAQIDVARATKEAKSGPYEGWFAEAVFLPISEDPSAQKWMAYYADKFEEIQDFSAYPLNMAITPDHIYCHSYKLRHPQR